MTKPTAAPADRIMLAIAIADQCERDGNVAPIVALIAERDALRAAMANLVASDFGSAERAASRALLSGGAK